MYEKVLLKLGNKSILELWDRKDGFKIGFYGNVNDILDLEKILDNITVLTESSFLIRSEDIKNDFIKSITNNTISTPEIESKAKKSKYTFESISKRITEYLNNKPDGATAIEITEGLGYSNSSYTYVCKALKSMMKDGTVHRYKKGKKYIYHLADFSDLKRFIDETRNAIEGTLR